MADSFFRVSGLASGIDTASVIDQLVAIERRPIIVLQNKQQLLSWKQNFWSEINTSLKALKTSTDSLRESTTIGAKTATSNSETVLTATALSSAAAGTYNITEIESLANTTKVTSGGSYIGTTVDAAQLISGDDSRFGTQITEGTFTINSVQFTLSDEDSDGDIDRIAGGGTTTDAAGDGLTLNEIISHLNNATVKVNTGLTDTTLASDELTLTNDVARSGQEILLGSAGDTSNLLTATHLKNAEQNDAGDGSKTSTVHMGHARVIRALSSGNFGTAITGDGGGDGAFKINGVEITYNKDADALADVITRINNSEAGVVAAYDSTADKLILTSKDTGALSILREDVTGNFLDAMDLLDSDSATISSGANAKFKIEGFNGGDWIYSNSNIVSGVINGVSITLKDTLAAVDGPVILNVNHNTTKAKDAIKDFVNKYNAAMTLINTRLSEPKVADPETDYDRTKGLLRGNTLLTYARTELSKITMNMVSRDYDDTEDSNPLSAALDQLSEIGITITDDDFGKSGNLAINEDILDEKLRDNPEGVVGLFNYDSSTDSRDGVARKISDFMDFLTSSSTQIENGRSYKEGAIARRQDSMQNEIDYWQDRINDLEKRLEKREERFIMEFTAMESALSELQNMGNWIASQIGTI